MIKELLVGEWGAWHDGEYHTLLFTDDNFTFHDGNVTCGERTFRVSFEDGCIHALGAVFCRTSARNVAKLPQKQS